MSELQPLPPGPGVHAYPAGAIRVVLGANAGDPIGGREAVEPGDVYRLKAAARSRRLVLSRPESADAEQTISAGSEIGQPGERVHPLALLTLLSPHGEKVGIVTLWHEATAATFAIPLSPIVAGTDYTLVDVGGDFAGLRLADVICVSFAAGTLIARDGARPEVIERIRPCDMILTRDSGPQPVRWIGKATLRAAGSFAPVVISAGTLGNLGDLVVSPHHRVFLYQRGPHRLAGMPEVLVQAKHLVDGDRVWRREGGFVDYYSLVFDRHEIIFAEGIAAESLMVNERTVRLLPDELADDLKARFPGLRQRQHPGTEAPRDRVNAVGRARLFRSGRDTRG